MDKTERLLAKVLVFRDKRQWQQFHTARNLATSLSIEASEILEIFKWKLDHNLILKERLALEEELADVFMNLLLLANTLKIDLFRAAAKKLKINARKYPIQKSKGKSTKYTDL